MSVGMYQITRRREERQSEFKTGESQFKSRWTPPASQQRMYHRPFHWPFHSHSKSTRPRLTSLGQSTERQRAAPSIGGAQFQRTLRQSTATSTLVFPFPPLTNAEHKRPGAQPSLVSSLSFFRSDNTMPFEDSSTLPPSDNPVSSSAAPRLVALIHTFIERSPGSSSKHSMAASQRQRQLSHRHDTCSLVRSCVSAERDR